MFLVLARRRRKILGVSHAETSILLTKSSLFHVFLLKYPQKFPLPGADIYKKAPPFKQICLIEGGGAFLKRGAFLIIIPLMATYALCFLVAMYLHLDYSWHASLVIPSQRSRSRRKWLRRPQWFR